MPEPNLDSTDKLANEIPSQMQTELRLALVMNGGSSLAVWMGGVTHEIDLLRRASRGDSESTVANNDLESFQTWRSIAQNSGKKVCVDIISGASAGGLNGTILATSIARDTPLNVASRMWHERAALWKLVFGIRERGILSGRKVTKLIRETLVQIPPGNNPSDEPITLFLTATALRGQGRLFQDGYGQQFSVDDHRRVFCFRNNTNDWQYTKNGENWYFKKINVTILPL